MTSPIGNDVTLLQRRFTCILAGAAPCGFLASGVARTLAFSLLLVSSFNSSAALARAETQAEGSNWIRLSALPDGTHVHITADRMSKACFLAAVDDEKLACSRKKNPLSADYTFVRAEVRSVKLVRYRRSTLAGLGIGLGAGLGAGAIAGQVASPKTNSWLDLSAIGREVITGIGGVAGLVAGGAICCATDSLRGPAIYLRRGTRP